MRQERPDRTGPWRQQYATAKKIILASQSICGICGRPVDKTLKAPHPMSPTVDHIVPVSKGGHPADLDNLQLAHWICNRQKSDKLGVPKAPDISEDVNRLLPQSRDWATE